MLAVLGGLEPKSGPNPSGKAEKLPKPEREQGAKGVGPPEAAEASEQSGACTHFFYRY